MDILSYRKLWIYRLLTVICIDRGVIVFLWLFLAIRRCFGIVVT